MFFRGHDEWDEDEWDEDEWDEDEWEESSVEESNSEVKFGSYGTATSGNENVSTSTARDTTDLPRNRYNQAYDPATGITYEDVPE